MCRTEVLTRQLGTKLQNRYSQGRNRKSAISGYLAALYSYMFPRRKGRKGIFVGYSETSKAFRIYIPGFKQIETSRDVTFDEDEAFNKSRRHRAEEVLDEEPEAPRAIVRDDEEHDQVDHDMTEPQMPEPQMTEPQMLVN